MSRDGRPCASPRLLRFIRLVGTKVLIGLFGQTLIFDRKVNLDQVIPEEFIVILEARLNRGWGNWLCGSRRF